MWRRRPFPTSLIEFPRRIRDTSRLQRPLHRRLRTSHLLQLTMSARIMPRFALRQSRIAIQRRAASNTSEAAGKAKQVGSEAASKAQETASKAQEGLSRVQSSASEKLSSAGSAVSKSLSGVGGRTGQLISFVNSGCTRLPISQRSH